MINANAIANWIAVAVVVITMQDIGKLPTSTSTDSRSAERDIVDKIFPDQKKVICKYEYVNQDCHKCSRQICSDGKKDWESNVLNCTSDGCITTETGPHDKEKWEEEDLRKAFDSKKQ